MCWHSRFLLFSWLRGAQQRLTVIRDLRVNLRRHGCVFRHWLAPLHNKRLLRYCRTEGAEHGRETGNKFFQHNQ